MTRGFLPKAYLRIDPNIDQTHPDNLGEFVRLLCLANRQTDRGRFKHRPLLDALLGKAAARRAVERGDAVEMPDGSYYVDGWEEWQEGDYTVGDRMARLRQRMAAEGRSAAATRTANWRLRNRIFERDAFTCRYCGTADYPREWLVAEHVIPQPDGPTTFENLVTACRVCNKRKGGRTPEQAGMVLLPERDASPPITETHHNRKGPSDASRRLGVKALDAPSGANPPAHEGGNDPYDAPELPALSWLTEQGCYIAPVSGYYRQLVLVVENYGVEAVIAKFDILKKAGVKRGDVRNFLFGAIDALNGKVDIKGLETEERAEADRDRRTRAADVARKAAEDEDARRARLLAEKPRPLRELMPDVKIGRASS